MTNGFDPGKTGALNLGNLEQQAVLAEMQQQRQQEIARQHKLRIDQFITDTASRIYAGLVVERIRWAQQQSDAPDFHVDVKWFSTLADVATEAAPELAAKLGMITFQQENADVDSR